MSLKDLIKKPTPKASAQSPTTAPSPKRTDSRPSARKKILVLDDDASFGELIMRYKNKYDVDVEFFENVHQFVQRLSEEKFDVVIVDYYLEGYNGTQLAALIHDTPVILVSNKNNWQDTDTTAMPATSRFIHKKAGPDKILSEALSLARR